MTQKDIANYYEKYWQHRKKTGKIYKDTPTRMDIAVKYFPSHGNNDWLDIGCGEGYLGKIQKKNPTLKSKVGIDVSKTALELAKKYYTKTHRLDVSSAKTPILRQKFNVISALEIIEHLIQPNNLLKFAHNHLKDDGRFIVSFPNTAWWKYRKDLLKGEFIDEDPTFTERDHLSFFTLHSITRLLNQNNFWVESIDGAFVLPWYFGRLPHQIQRAVGKKFPNLFGYQLVLVCRKVSKKPTVAHVTNDYLNGSEPWIHTQVTTSKNTHAIVLTRNLKNQHQFYHPSIFKQPLLWDDLDSHKFSQMFLKKLAGPFQRLKDSLGAQNRFYLETLKRAQPQVIHTHFGTVSYQLIDICKKLGIPLVASFYGSDAYWLPQNHSEWRRKYLELFKVVDAIIVKGPKMKEQLISLGCQKAKIHVIDHGVVMSQIPFKVRKPTAKPRLLMASRLIDYKGVNHAIAAFKQIIKDFPGATLTIVGDGPEKKLLQNQIKILELSHSVEMIPFMEHSELIKLAQKHHVFIQASYDSLDGKKEGIPTSLIERVASGMPVVATRHSDQPEVVKSGKNGYLCQPDNPNSLANSIIKMLTDQSKWSEFGKFGRNLVQKNFNASTQTQKREKLYKKLIKR